MAHRWRAAAFGSFCIASGGQPNAGALADRPIDALRAPEARRAAPAVRSRLTAGRATAPRPHGSGEPHQLQPLLLVLAGRGVALVDGDKGWCHQGLALAPVALVNSTLYLASSRADLPVA